MHETDLRLSPEDELSLLREVFDGDDLVTEMMSATDVDTVKPKPDIIHVTLDRAGVLADRAIFVGDATWDAPPMPAICCATSKTVVQPRKNPDPTASHGGCC